MPLFMRLPPEALCHARYQARYRAHQRKEHALVLTTLDQRITPFIVDTGVDIESTVRHAPMHRLNAMPVVNVIAEAGQGAHHTNITRVFPRPRGTGHAGEFGYALAAGPDATGISPERDAQ
jgi:hypothetical protein